MLIRHNTDTVILLFSTHCCSDCSMSPHSHSPFSVSEITAPAPSPYWRAAAPCPDIETKIAHGPTETATEIKTMLFDRIGNKVKPFINERVLPAAQSCLFLFLFAAPFPHKDAGSRYRALLLFCKQFMTTWSKERF